MVLFIVYEWLEILHIQQVNRQSLTSFKSVIEDDIIQKMRSTCFHHKGTSFIWACGSRWKDFLKMLMEKQIPLLLLLVTEVVISCFQFW